MVKQPSNDAEEEKLMMKIMVTKARTCDELFETTGVEQDHLRAAIFKLELTNDEEFIQLVQENDEIINK